MWSTAYAVFWILAYSLLRLLNQKAWSTSFTKKNYAGWIQFCNPCWFKMVFFGRVLIPDSMRLGMYFWKCSSRLGLVTSLTCQGL